MRSLIVTKFVPEPPDSGGKLRSRAMVKMLAELGAVDLVAFDDGRSDPTSLEQAGVSVHSVPYRPSQAKAALGLAEMQSISGARFWDRRTVGTIRRLAGRTRYDVVQIEYSTLAPYARHAGPAATRVLDLHNVESQLVASSARVRHRALRPVVLAEARAIERIEHRGLERFDLTVVVSDDEAARLPHRGHKLVCPNGWTMPDAVPAAVSLPVAIFVGLLGWAPNADASAWLAREIWPIVLRRVPEAKLLLVGRDPGPEVTGLASAAVEVVPSPPDITPYLARAAVALAPLRAGGGSRLKILEALGAARPVVATALGAEGLHHLVGDGIVLAEDAEAIAGAIVDLFADPAAAHAKGLAGRDRVAADLSWERTLAPLRAELVRRSEPAVG
jgi:glycosyltransferase involved in cell wall biosynthesis